MAKVNAKGLQKKLDDLQNSLNTTKDNFIVGKFVVSMIRQRTRNEGKGVSRTGANARKLKNVTPEWALRRQKTNRHPKAANGLASNLTFKGTMLNSMDVLRATKNGFFIGFKSELQADKAEGNAANGRPFMFLSKGEITKTSAFIKKQILK